MSGSELKVGATQADQFVDKMKEAARSAPRISVMGTFGENMDKPAIRFFDGSTVNILEMMLAVYEHQESAG